MKEKKLDAEAQAQFAEPVGRCKRCGLPTFIFPDYCTVHAPVSYRENLLNKPSKERKSEGNPSAANGIECPMCGNVFDSEASLKDHQLTVYQQFANLRKNLERKS